MDGGGVVNGEDFVVHHFGKLFLGELLLDHLLGARLSVSDAVTYT